MQDRTGAPEATLVAVVFLATACNTLARLQALGACSPLVFCPSSLRADECTCGHLECRHCMGCFLQVPGTAATQPPLGTRTMATCQ